MRKFLTLTLCCCFTLSLFAQDNAKNNELSLQKTSFDNHTKIISFSLGLPDLHRINYEEPKGYTHIKTSGFGPFYAKMEFAAFDRVGLVIAYGYSTFHYSYYGLAYAPAPTPPQQVIYYDDVNTLNLSFSANYHFAKFIKNPHLDIYAGVGAGINYFQYRYGNIPPYRERETKATFFPVGRIGCRYYLDGTLGLFGEAGYDGISVGQLGFSVRF